VRHRLRAQDRPHRRPVRAAVRGRRHGDPCLPDRRFSGKRQDPLHPRNAAGPRLHRGRKDPAAGVRGGRGGIRAWVLFRQKRLHPRGDRAGRADYGQSGQVAEGDRFRAGGGGIQRHVDAGCALYRHAGELGGVSGVHVCRCRHFPDLQRQYAPADL